MQEYTVCFIQRKQQLLLLNRVKAPLMGLWNGVGGKIEPYESIKEGALREVFEETGIQCQNADYKGKVICNGNWGELNLHFFWIELQDPFNLHAPLTTEEGILDWKDIEWILNPDNKGIVSNLPMLLPEMISSLVPQNYILDYDQFGQIKEMRINSEVQLLT